MNKKEIFSTYSVAQTSTNDEKTLKHAKPKT